MEGIILKGVGSFYTVLGAAGETYVCKLRGRFRNDGVTPLPGDHVAFSPEPGGCRIDDIRPRKNLLTRPTVANIDILIIVMAASAPRPDLLLTDKLLVQCELLSIRPVLVLNKCDEADDLVFSPVLEDYRGSGYTLIQLSALTGEGKAALLGELTGKISCFAGQSAVGKSSLLNMLLPALQLPTGGLSAKTDRGKHTTRHAELWPAFEGAVLDTPGFSLLDMAEIEPETLGALYPEMRPYLGQCRFPACLHESEPDCAVKAALESGSISAGRYARYKILLNELKEKRKHKYD